MSAKSLQSCPILCDPWTVALGAPLSMGFPASILEWVAISFSRGSSPPRDQTPVSSSLALAGRLYTASATIGAKKKNYQQKSSRIQSSKRMYTKYPETQISRIMTWTNLPVQYVSSTVTTAIKTQDIRTRFKAHLPNQERIDPQSVLFPLITGVYQTKA